MLLSHLPPPADTLVDEHKAECGIAETSLHAYTPSGQQPRGSGKPSLRIHMSAPRSGLERMTTHLSTR